MPQPRHQPTALRRRVFLARDAIREGLLTADHLRGPAWQRVLRGVYADAALPFDHGLKTEAAALAIPSGAAVTGASAAWLWGVRFAAIDDPVDVVTPPGRRLGPMAGLRIRTSPVPPSDLSRRGGITLTTPLRTAWELSLRLDLIEAVTYCDALARLGRISPGRLTGYRTARSGQHGCRTAERVFALVDGRAESPQESRLRVQLALAGLPSPIPQYEIRSGRVLLARVDLAWPDLKVAVEYDGLWHAGAEQLIRDRERLNALQAVGWYVHHVTVRDMADIESTIAAIQEVLALRTSGGPRFVEFPGLQSR